MPRLSDASTVGSAGPTPRSSANLTGVAVITAPAEIPGARGAGRDSLDSTKSEFSKSWERQRDLTRDRLQERLYRHDSRHILGGRKRHASTRGGDGNTSMN